MKLKEIIDKLDLEKKGNAENLDIDITRGYASDLLSDVMANADENDLWVTLQIHQNIVAVAVLKSLSAIVLVNSREPEAETLEKANAEGIPILSTNLSAFSIVGKLHKMGIKG